MTLVSTSGPWGLNQQISKALAEGREVRSFALGRVGEGTRVSENGRSVFLLPTGKRQECMTSFDFGDRCILIDTGSAIHIKNTGGIATAQT